MFKCKVSISQKGTYVQFSLRKQKGTPFQIPLPYFHFFLYTIHDADSFAVFNENFDKEKK